MTPWYTWGPYLSERAWGTVREDYSADGSAWEYLPHDHARSRAYRWSEDGMAGICDAGQRLCLALALWNGNDPILKERMFGLTGNEGNHGEDVKEYFWYCDALPSGAYLRWRYHYPQQSFPYGRLVGESRARTRNEPEFDLLDTGVFNGNRYFVVEVSYAKADPNDLLMRIQVSNAGSDAAALHVLPTLWFRNTWAWERGATRPALSVAAGGETPAIVADHPDLGRYRLDVGAAPDGASPDLLFCENESNVLRLFPSAPATTPYPKDGINDYVLLGRPTVNPNRTGTKASASYQVTVAAGQTVELRLRLHRDGPAASLGDEFAQLMTTREAETDDFYAELAPPGLPDAQLQVMRQAFAGMIWCKQFYNYDVARWLDGDATQPPPPQQRRIGRNANWRRFNSADVISMPDAWEYPWFAAWDLAFHTVVLAHVDPTFAKYQLQLMCREWFQHANGAVPAYEWSFDDVNPPVHAWAALKVWALDGRRDDDFLKSVFLKLLLTFTWWVNRKDEQGDNLFEGGFLGLDNISVFDRSHLPIGGVLEQADATGWMAFFCLQMLQIARHLATTDRAFSPLVTKFLEHFAVLTAAINDLGLWDDTDQFFYDVLRVPGAEPVPLKVRSLVGVVPALATAVLDAQQQQTVAGFHKSFAATLAPRRDVLRNGQVARGGAGRLIELPATGITLVSVVDEHQLSGMLRALLDERRFLSPYGLRSLSAEYRGNPYKITVEGVTGSIDYEPAESTTGVFGGNSNWRGPVWMPLNYLFIDALAEFGERFGNTLTVEMPTGSGRQATLFEAAADLRSRLLALFLPGPDGRRPCYGDLERLQSDPAWRNHLLFFEYFHGDDGAGLGAMHQTGWTGLIADLLCGMRGVASGVPRPAAPTAPAAAEPQTSQ